ncbi:hypothetical protein WA158_002766 [Blastocystis sp. Blastoise]
MDAFSNVSALKSMNGNNPLPSIPMSFDWLSLTLMGSILGVTGLICYKKSRAIDLSKYSPLRIAMVDIKDINKNQPIYASVEGVTMSRDLKGNKIQSSLITKSLITVVEDEYTEKNKVNISQTILGEHIETQKFIIKTNEQEIIVDPEYCSIIKLQKEDDETICDTNREKYMNIIKPSSLSIYKHATNLCIQKYSLYPNTDVCLYGQLVKENDKYLLKGTKNSPLLISIDNQQESQKSTYLLSILFSVFSIVCFSFSFLEYYLL